MTGDLPNPPCVVFDSSVVERQCHALRSYLDRVYPRSRLFYALKACYLPPVVERILASGCGLEVSTPSEQSIARHFGLAGSRIVWNSPCLDEMALQGIVERGELLNVDSPCLFSIVDRVASSLGKRVQVGLRLNPFGQGRLGMTPDQAEALLRRSPRVEVVGLHIHIGQGDRMAGAGLAEKQWFLEMIGRWESAFDLRLEFVNLGGGLLVGEPPEVSLAPLLTNLEKLKSSPELHLEPGAYLVEEAGTAYSRVVATKTVGSAHWALLDVGANFLVPLERAHFSVTKDDDVRQDLAVHFGGPFCFEADVIAKDQLVAVAPGNIVKISRCGAYTASMSSCFFSAPPPVFWLEHGHYVALRRQPSTQASFLLYHGYPAPTA